MRRLRFTIASLLVVVLFVVVGFAALRESNETWDSSIFSVTLGAILISILLAVHRTESRRAFWLGFALFGSVYVGLSLIPSIESRLITTKALAFLDSKVPGRSVEQEVVLDFGTGSATGNNRVSNVTLAFDRAYIASSSQGLVRRRHAVTGKLLFGGSGTTENFVRIGHSLFALLVGWLGAQLSRRLCRASRHAEVSTAVESGVSAPISTSI